MVDNDGEVFSQDSNFTVLFYGSYVLLLVFCVVL